MARMEVGTPTEISPLEGFFFVHAPTHAQAGPASAAPTEAALAVALPFADLLPSLYDELRTLAATAMRGERRQLTMQVTALVHEAYLRMSSQQNLAITSREGFMAAAAITIRRLLVEFARSRNTQQRGLGWQRISLEDTGQHQPDNFSELLAIHEALGQFATHHPRAAQVVEMRYFGAMTVPEVAAALKVSTTTIDADWALAKAWLRRALRDSESAVP